MRARTTRLRSFCFGIAKTPSFCPRASPPSSEALERRSASTQPGSMPPFASASDLRWGRPQEVRRESNAEGGDCSGMKLLRQRHHKRRPAPRRALYLDVPAVLEDQVFGDGQAEAGA